MAETLLQAQLLLSNPPRNTEMMVDGDEGNATVHFLIHHRHKQQQLGTPAVMMI